MRTEGGAREVLTEELGDREPRVIVERLTLLLIVPVR